MMGQLGGLGVLDLEGLWTRYEDPEPVLAEIREPRARAARPTRMQELYAEPIKPELVTARLAEIRAAGVTVAGALTPAAHAGALRDRRRRRRRPVRHPRHHRLRRARLEEPVEPLNLKKFIYELDVPVIVGGAATYTAALHLMRTGAAGVLVGFGGGAASTTRATLGIHAPMATAVADVAGARRDYLDESGGRYVHVIADGGLGTRGDIVKAISVRRRRRHARRGARPRDRRARAAAATGAPRRTTPKLPRGNRVQVGQVAPLEEILYGPAPVADGTREPHRRAAPLDGDHRLLRPQGVPARRGRRRAVPRA